MIDFVVHDEGDSVGVVVVEGVKAGDELTGWIMDQDTDIKFTAASDIPIGHKLAIRPLKEGDTVIKYGVDICKVVADIGMGAATVAAVQPREGNEIEAVGTVVVLHQYFRLGHQRRPWPADRLSDLVRSGHRCVQ